jgi:hypothetical protein
LLLRPSWAEVPSSAWYSWTPSACVLPSLWETKDSVLYMYRF